MNRRLSIRPHTIGCPEWSRILCLLIMAAVFVGGCGGDGVLEDPLLDDILVSESMKPYLESSIRSLAEADQVDPAIRKDLERYAWIHQNLYTKDRSAAAADSLYALWGGQPRHVLWPELAVKYRKFIGRHEDRERMFSRPASPDTATAVGTYFAGWRGHSVASYATLFPLAQSRVDDLDPFSALWLDLRAAYGSRLAGDPVRFVPVLLDDLQVARSLGGSRLEAFLWEEIARAKLAQGELDDALHAAVVADTLAGVGLTGQVPVADLLKIRSLKADVLAARTESADALAVYESVTETAAALGLDYLASLNLNRAAMSASASGNRDMGLRLCRRGLEFSIADQDSLNVPRHLMNMASRFRNQGDLDSCLVYQNRASRWVAAFPDPDNIAGMPLMQAGYYAQVGEYAVVDSLLHVATVLNQGTSDAEARAELHLELIRGWMEMDRPDLIYRSIEAIEDMRTGTGDSYADRHVVADLNLLIGKFHTHRHDFALAAEALDMAAAALESRPNPMRSWTLAGSRGRLDRERGSLASAERHFRTCIDLGARLESPELESTGRFLLGSVLMELGRYAEARDALPDTDEQAFVGRFTTRVSALLLKGMSYTREGNFDQAILMLDEARSACRSWSPADLVGRIDLAKGRALAGAGRAEESARLYDRIADRLADAGAADTRSETVDFNSDLRRDLVEAVLELPNRRPEQTLRLARRVLPNWRSSMSSYEDATHAPQVIYFVGKGTSGRWTVADDAVRWDALPGEGEMNRLLAPVLADMAVPGREVVSTDAAMLAAMLLDGVDDVWSPGETLAVVPDLALFGVPWAALTLPGSDAAVVDHGPLAIRDMPATSTASERPHRSDGRLLVVGADGDADASRSGLKELHHAEREARDIASTWPADLATLRVGDAAARALSPDEELGGYEAIHVASHAVVFEGHSEKTMLLLAGDGDEALTAASIGELDLAAELVYLSCCEAAGGRHTRSGFAGLARSFLDAGARNVVAPLIAIDDEAGRAMATRFYSHWLSGMAVPAALRSAQLDLRDGDPKWSHPFYWAFYQPIVGDAAAARN